MNINYKKLTATEVNPSLFDSFNRYQEVTKCWRKIDGEWVIKDIAFTEQWSDNDYITLVGYLTNSTIVYGAFHDDKLIGFTSLEGEFFGETCKYLQLSCLHVSFGYRGNGIGKRLFYLICESAKKFGADKLYISAHSSVESQGFYKSLGCVETLEYNAKLLELEPYDCHLEFNLF